jgi:addiction module HigA family antidote
MNDQLGHTGMTPSHPGQIVREEVLEELDLSVSKAAELLGVRRATLSDLVHEKAALSPEMALRLEKAFGLSMDMMLRIQSWYDASMMRARADEIDVEAYVPAAPGAHEKADR